jgi:hypothetical protein
VDERLMSKPVKPLEPWRFRRADEPAREPSKEAPAEDATALVDILLPVYEAVAWYKRCADVHDARNGLLALWLVQERLQAVWLRLCNPQDADLLPVFAQTLDEGVAWLALEDHGDPDLFASLRERALQLRLACRWYGNA